MKNPINMVNKTLYMFPFVFPNIKIAKPTGIYSKDHCIEKTVPVSIAFSYSGKRVIKVSIVRPPSMLFSSIFVNIQIGSIQ